MLLTVVRVTVLGGRPTKKHSVGCFALFGIRLIDRCVDSRVFWLPSWAFAQQRSVLSGVLRFSVSVQSTDAWTLGSSGYRPGQSPGKEAFCRVFCGFRYPRSAERCVVSRGFWLPSWAVARQRSILSGVLRFSVSVQSTDAWTLGCSGYRPGRSPGKEAFCRVFCAFRYPFSRQISSQ